MARAIDIDKRTFEFAVNICKLADKISNTTPSRTVRERRFDWID